MAKIRRIGSARALANGVAALAAADAKLGAIAARVGPLSHRKGEEGFEALAEIVVSQQLSSAAADTIFGRLKSSVTPFEPDVLLAASDEVLRNAGLSAPKQRHIRAIAGRISSGALDLSLVAQLPDAEAHAHLVETPGIGPWTAEIYLMSSLHRADVWPTGDVALQAAVAHALGLRKRPDAKKLAKLGEQWRPWRTIAARLFWAHYRVAREEEKRARAAAALKPKRCLGDAGRRA